MYLISFLFAITLVLFSIFYTKEKYNAFILANIVNIATTFLMPLIGTFFTVDLEISAVATVFNIIALLVFFIMYLRGRKKEAQQKQEEEDNSNGSYLKVLLFISLAINTLFVLYNVLSYGFASSFINSRAEIYMQNRQGSGQIYYVAATFLNIYVIIGMFIFKRPLFHLFICILFVLPYGSKSRILIILFQFLIYFLFIHKNRYKYKKPIYLLLLIIITPIIGFVLFWFTTYGLDSLEIVQMGLSFGNEYQSFFNELVINFNSYFPRGHLGGKILLEDSLYPFIPRAIWGSKPEYFGSLYLAYQVFPEKTLMNTGAPSFGPFGQAFADFGLFGIVQIIIEQAFIGYFLGRFELRVIKNRSVKNFMLLIAIGFGGILGIGGAINPVVMGLANIGFISILFAPVKRKVRSSNRKELQNI